MRQQPSQPDLSPARCKLGQGLAPGAHPRAHGGHFQERGLWRCQPSGGQSADRFPEITRALERRRSPPGGLGTTVFLPSPAPWPPQPTPPADTTPSPPAATLGRKKTAKRRQPPRAQPPRPPSPSSRQAPSLSWGPCPFLPSDSGQDGRPSQNSLNCKGLCWLPSPGSQRGSQRGSRPRSDRAGGETPGRDPGGEPRFSAPVSSPGSASGSVWGRACTMRAQSSGWPAALRPLAGFSLESGDPM